MKRASCIFWLLLIHIFSAANGFDVFKENGKVGLKSDQGKVLIPAKYDALGWSTGKLTVVNNVMGYKVGGYWGLINLDNHQITKAIYEELVPAEDDLFVARKKSNLSLRLVAGCINTSGKEILDFQYDGISITNQRAIVFTRIRNQFKYGLVDLANKTLIPQQFKTVSSLGQTRYAVKNFDDKIALFTDAGKQETPFEIDSISSYKKNYAIIYKGLQQGLVDNSGAIKVRANNREMLIEDDGQVFKRDLDEWLFVDGQNKLIQKKLADSVRVIGKNVLQVVESGLVHLEDYKFAPTSPGSYSTLGKFVNRKAIFSSNHKVGVVRSDGTILVAAKYDKVYRDQQYFISNQRQAGKDNWIVLDSLGRSLHAKTYEHIYPFTGKIFPVSNRNYWGAIDASGKELIACAYDSIIQQLDEYVVVKFKGQYGVVSLREEWRVTPRPEKLRLISKTRFLEIGPKTTYLKAFDGNTIYFSDNFLEVQSGHLIEHLSDGNIWEVDLDGVMVDRKLQQDLKIKVVTAETEGLRGIKKNGQYGFIDSRGRLRIANRYDNIQSYQEQLAAVKIRGKWGFINHDDKIAIQPVYDVVLPFQYGFSIVSQKGFKGLIDKTGKVVLPPKYEEITVKEFGNILVKQEGLYGLSDRDGKILINPKFHSLYDQGNNYVIVGRDDKYGIVTVQGISTVPLIYDKIAYDRFNGNFLALKKAAWVRVQ
ncbi:MAG: WG repeat-containing protein [Chryseolinea sp.]